LLGGGNFIIYEDVTPLAFTPNVLKSAYSFLPLSFPFFASFVPLPPVVLVIPIR